MFDINTIKGILQISKEVRLDRIKTENNGTKQH
jgi:hypothetical protein